MNEIDYILKLYAIYSDDLQRYNTLIWQFPTALVTFNILAINYFISRPHFLFFIPLINFMLIHALSKQIYNQRAIINALRKIEEKLRKYYDSGMIPEFEIKSKVLKIKSAFLLLYGLLILNILFFFYTIWKLLYCK
jgi:hypothetical protein